MKRLYFFIYKHMLPTTVSFVVIINNSCERLLGHFTFRENYGVWILSYICLLLGMWVTSYSIYFKTGINFQFCDSHSAGMLVEITLPQGHQIPLVSLTVLLLLYVIDISYHLFKSSVSAYFSTEIRYQQPIIYQ